MPAMLLLEEMKRNGVKTISDSPVVYFKAFEDNSGTFKFSHTPKIWPRTQKKTSYIITYDQKS